MSSPSSSPPEIKLNVEVLQSLLATYPKDKPVHMLNLLRYRPSALYTSPSTTDTNTSDCTGYVAYHECYLPALRPILAEIGVEIVFMGIARAGLLEGSDQWDEVLIVRYPGIETFKRMSESERYQREAGVHRSAAVGGHMLIPMEVE
ncbi:hypothetical protein K504DRAFT_36177 [Pleomassaria siparia CBS 279.74]|uniref:DUF1330 domain-containing protein n=1 Tax=Pleomassaria siparia CBS 279.74 TaxID=1314801 RepID=A0A6G1K4T7_9PLEO|nr:hypothetical protein K504DRAFT_36177 [Pleomassaria siparia CBS 279.74]